ncbi:redox-sensitive transcriptional activator SoxR [Ahrensia kielensis]|uniref:Redox-sensitive transcriptional activator SoxR n=1 Tax=Ahrensia kielensis TaxID=76980 RepID=A0ABU9T783_9HYPH
MKLKKRKFVTLSIGEVAERTGIKVSAVRFYEDEGLIQAIRSEGGNRRFMRSEIRKVSFISIAQRLGFTLSEIRGELEKLPDDRAPNKKDWEKISRSFRTVLDERIAMMERLRDRLDGCIGCGCLSLQKCKLYNQDDWAAHSGFGPRWILEPRKSAD